MNRNRVRIQRRLRSLPEGEYRERCYGCFRPVESCFCAAIPNVENRTDVLILQHRRERTHPFNTARIVNQALQQCQLIHNHNDRFAGLELPIQSKCGLLYPGEGSRLLSDLQPDERPKQLVVLDGTWHHAKTLFRDVPQIQNLPRYRLAPKSPGQFRIRLEPTLSSLSTLEATVQALQQLEPETPGLVELMNAFHVMVEQQLAHPQAKYGDDQPTPKVHNLNVPKLLAGDLSNVVVVYGETMPPDSPAIGSASDRKSQPPVYWVARRLVSGATATDHANQTFTQFIKPSSPITQRFLDYMKLSANDFTEAVSVDSFRLNWKQFLKPDDVLVAHSHSIVQLLKNAGVATRPYEVLKSINHDPHREFKSLREFFEARSFPVEEVIHTGRAGIRLANAATMVRYLNSLKHM